MRILSYKLRSDEEEEVRRVLAGMPFEWQAVSPPTRASLESILADSVPGLLLAASDAGSPEGFDLLTLASDLGPAMPCVLLVRGADPALERSLSEAGAADAFAPEQLWRLRKAAARVLERAERHRDRRKIEGMEVLLEAVKDLSLARRMEDIVDIVRQAARRLSQADGATFVLRDGDQCHYVDEDAIGPLWRGRRFPMTSCISGWAMLNRRPAAIPDIYKDDRIPIDAYRPTFVRSLVMVPIRTEAPIGAIGTYWAQRREISGEEVALIQLLADSTALAVEKVQFLVELERRVKERTESLEGVNKELEAFSYSVSHDLRSPLAVIMGYSDLLLDDPAAGFAERERRMIMDVRTAAVRMQGLIDDLLRLSRVSKREMAFDSLDLSEMAREILAGFSSAEPERKTSIRVAETPVATGDPALMRIALENLLSNAWKYSSTRSEARIEFGAARDPDGSVSYFVRDNGVGFDMDKAGRLFEPFQRLHSSKDFQGTGIGLATVNRVVQKHGGRVWAESRKDQGSTFRFSLPPPPMALDKSSVSAFLAA